MKEQIDVIVTSKDLRDITNDMVEKVLDSQISDEVLKEFPVVKSLVAIKNLYSSYSDRIFIKKAMNVLLELGDVNWKERVELTRELNDKNSSGTDKILLAIDRLETIEKCKVFGRLCKLKALKKINVDDYLRLTKLIQDSYLKDLELVPYFLEKKKDKKRKIYEEEFVPLLSLGLIYQQPSEQKPIERITQIDEHSPGFKGGDIEFEYLLSILGDTLNKYYFELFPEQKKIKLSDKIEFSLFFVFAFFFFRITGKIMVRKLKKFHLKHNPKLVESAPGIFTFFTLFYKAASIMCLICIIMIWIESITM